MGTMKDLDKSKVYYLGDLSDEQLDQVCEWLKKNDTDWGEFVIHKIKNKIKKYIYYFNSNKEWVFNTPENKINTTNALELFDDKTETIPPIEDVQIDLRLLTPEERSNCISIVNKNGYGYWYKILNNDSVDNYHYLSKSTESKTNLFETCVYNDAKTTITYDQFVKWYDKGLDPSVEFDKKSKDEQEQIAENINNVLKKESILQEAERIINGARAEDYGDVEENFTRIADGWKVIFGIKNISPRQVAHAMTWLKICRDLNTPKRDNLVDICGYTGCIEKMENKEKV